MAQTVSHEGIVIKITNDAIVVRILQQEACGACRAKELCGNGTEKDITIPIEYAEGYREGGRVQVEMSEELGLQATIHSSKFSNLTPNTLRAAFFTIDSSVL